jgi:hypothetical protein
MAHELREAALEERVGDGRIDRGHRCDGNTRETGSPEELAD